MNNRVDRLQNTLNRKFTTKIECSQINDSIRLEGDLDTLSDWLSAGYLAAKDFGYKVINDITISGVGPTSEPRLKEKTQRLKKNTYDVLIIGGGVIGASVARELSRYKISVCNLEKESDVACHTSSRNDGMIHPGFAASPGTLKAELNVKGNRAYSQICEELQVPLSRPGSLMLLKSRLYLPLIPIMLDRAKKNGVDGEVRFLSKREVRRLEPNLSDDHFGAMNFPSAGQLSPYGLTIALAEHAVQNGVDINFNTEVLEIQREQDRIEAVRTNNGMIHCKVLINAAGCWSDRIAELAGDRYFSLHFRKGVDCILDKALSEEQTMIAANPILFKTHASHSKGGGIVPCVEGNILIGPTAQEIFSRDDYATHLEDFDALFKIMSLNKRFSKKDIITYFAGIRSCSWNEDFIIEKSPVLENMIHIAGIQSPGLASAPAIGEKVKGIVLKILGDVNLDPTYSQFRKVTPNVSLLNHVDKTELLFKRPDYGNIVCRCENISEGEIRDVLRSKIPPMTLDGIKKRTRSGSGRCHGAFCAPKILSIMSDELGIPIEDIEKNGHGSQIVMGKTKQGGTHD